MFLDVAKQVDADRLGDEPFVDSAAATLCILGGIAASDSACAKALGFVAKGQNHREACALLAQVMVGRQSGAVASRALAELLAMKDEAQYGVIYLSGEKLRNVFRRLEVLIAFAEAVLQS
ncbi:MAG: hypothetical protein ACYCUD_10985 [Candidatus Dormibacteria bacterium]